MARQRGRLAFSHSEPLAILWVSARALYGVREHPDEDFRAIILSSWL